MFDKLTGFTIEKSVLSVTACEHIISLLPECSYKIRDVLSKVPAIIPILKESGVLGHFKTTHIRRSVLFAKPPAKNWKVPWHQDILVQIDDTSGTDASGEVFIKEGIPHICPPQSVMENIVSVRIHLTECHASDGPLRVKPNTHSFGYTEFNGISDLDSSNSTNVLCDAGDVLYFSPLLLHSSMPTQSDKPRMVLHLELSDHNLPAPYSWRHGE